MRAAAKSDELRALQDYNREAEEIEQQYKVLLSKCNRCEQLYKRKSTKRNYQRLEDVLNQFKDARKRRLDFQRKHKKFHELSHEAGLNRRA